MTTVAIIGVDGAGKTTVARALETSSAIPVKYLYMGANIESSNHALLTSRLILFAKKQKFRWVARREGITDPAFLSTHHDAHRAVKYGTSTSVLRMINRLADLSYRQLISWLCEARGFVVIYDRHVLFDAANPAGRHTRWPERAYYWILSNVYPQPDLVVFLDAPSELLHARKREGTIEYLDARRRAFVAQGEQVRRFVRVDASQPLESVLKEVDRCIAEARSGSPALQR